MDPERLGADGLAALFRRKAEAELASSEASLGARSIAWSGEADAGIALVKGTPGEADVRDGRALAGLDGDAARKALVALGLGDRVFATVSRPVPSDHHTLVARLALQLEAVDPGVIVALDPLAAADVAEALTCTPPRPGAPVRVRGRIVLALEGLEASLGDETAKRRVWQQFQALRSAPPA